MMRFVFILLMLLPAALHAAPVATTARHMVVATADQELPATRIDRLFLDGQYEVAFEQLSEYLDRNKVVSAAFLHNRGLLERQLGLNDGYEWFAWAFESEPDYYLNAWSLGRVLLERDSLDRAEELLRLASELDDRYQEATVDLAVALRRQDKLLEAANLLEGFIRRERTDPRAHGELAATYRLIGDYERAERVLHQGLEQFPHEPVLWQMIHLSRDRGDENTVIRTARRYLQLFPRSERIGEIKALLQDLIVEMPENTASEQSFESDTLAARVHEGYNHYPELEEIESYPIDSVIPSGQRLIYSVYWGPVRLGRITANISDGLYNGKSCWIAKYTVDATAPFVSISDTFYAWIDRELQYTHRFDIIFHERDETGRRTLVNDYDRGRSVIRTYESSGYWAIQELPLPPGVLDPASQIWLIQQHTYAGLGGDINIAVDNTFEQTTIEQPRRGETFELDGILVNTVQLNGFMPYSGLAGVSGGFNARLMSEAPGLPVEAEFDAFFGAVKVKLERIEKGELRMAEMDSEATNQPPLQMIRSRIKKR